MKRAIAMAEFAHIPSGVLGGDRIVKASPVEIIWTKIISPGRFTILFTGELGAVKEGLETVKREYEKKLLDNFLLGSPHKELLEALTNNRVVGCEGLSLGILETRTVASCIRAADAAVKAAPVSIVNLEFFDGLCGRSFFMVSGTLAGVEEAMAWGKKAAEGFLNDLSLVPAPDRKLISALKGINK